MQGYENIFILDPNVSEENQKVLLDKLKGIVSSNGGQVVHETTWGRRKLAYEVKKREYGIYHLLYLDRTPAALQALETQLGYEDDVIKWMSVTVDDVHKEHEEFETLKSQGTLYPNLNER